MPAPGFTPQRRIDIAGVLVIAALTAAVVMGLIMPAWRVHQASLHSGVQLAAQQQSASQAATQLRHFQRQAAGLALAVAHRPLHLSPTSALNERLAQITALAAANHLHVEGIEPGDPKPAAHTIRQPIKVTGQGSFDSATRFLHQLHQRLPDVAVRALTLTGKPTQPQAASTFTFSMEWYAAPG